MNRSAARPASKRTKSSVSKLPQRTITTTKKARKAPLRKQQRRAIATFPDGEYLVDSKESVLSLEKTPTFHASVNPERAPEFWDYNSFVPEFGDVNNYEIDGPIAVGRHSQIMSGFAVNSNTRLAIKTMMPISPHKINRQALALVNLKNLPHVQNCIDIIKDDESNTHSFVTVYSPHEPLESFRDAVSFTDAVTLAFRVFDGLDNIHSRGIMHRNIHPGNVLLNPKGKKDVTIVDFDNCEFYHQAQYYATRRITKKGWLSPEMALNMQDYHYAVDCWGAGVIVAQMFYPTVPQFQVKENQTDVDFIAQIVGSEALAQMIEKYDLHADLDDSVVAALQANYPALDFAKLPSKKTSPHVVELLSQVLVADPEFRMLPFEITTLELFDSQHEDAAEIQKERAAEKANPKRLSDSDSE